MAQRRIDRDLDFQPDIYRLLLLRLKTTAPERVVRILSKPDGSPKLGRANTPVLESMMKFTASSNSMTAPCSSFTISRSEILPRNR